MHGGAYEVLTLVARIYDAALEPRLWPQVMTELAEAVGGAQVVMGFQDPEPRCVPLPLRRESDGQASFRAHRDGSGSQWQPISRMPVGEVVLLRAAAARDDAGHTHRHREWRRSVATGAAALGVNLFSMNGLPVVCGVTRLNGAQPFTQCQLDLFTAVAPHLSRAAQTHYRFWRLDLQEGLARRGAEARSQAAIVVDAGGRVLFANDIATELLRTCEGIVIEGARLTAVDRDTARSLRQLIAACACTNSNGTSPGGALPVARRSRTALQLVVAPFLRRSDGAWWYGASHPAAQVLFSDPERDREIRAGVLRRTFRLTAAEASLALEICGGGGRAAAATRLGISPGTARIHLQRVFEKTGVHRQAELVRLVTEVDARLS